MASRLPIALSPAHHETVVSYLSRLATLDGMPLAELWPQVSRPRRAAGTSLVIDGELLAGVTGLRILSHENWRFPVDRSLWLRMHDPRNAAATRGYPACCGGRS